MGGGGHFNDPISQVIAIFTLGSTFLIFIANTTGIIDDEMAGQLLEMLFHLTVSLPMILIVVGGFLIMMIECCFPKRQNPPIAQFQPKSIATLQPKRHSQRLKRRVVRYDPSNGL